MTEVGEETAVVSEHESAPAPSADDPTQTPISAQSSPTEPIRESEEQALPNTSPSVPRTSPEVPKPRRRNTGPALRSRQYREHRGEQTLPPLPPLGLGSESTSPPSSPSPGSSPRTPRTPKGSQTPRTPGTPRTPRASTTSSKPPKSPGASRRKQGTDKSKCEEEKAAKSKRKEADGEKDGGDEDRSNNGKHRGTEEAEEHANSEHKETAARESEDKEASKPDEGSPSMVKKVPPPRPTTRPRLKSKSHSKKDLISNSISHTTSPSVPTRSEKHGKPRTNSVGSLDFSKISHEEGGASAAPLEETVLELDESDDCEGGSGGKSNTPSTPKVSKTAKRKQAPKLISDWRCVTKDDSIEERIVKARKGAGALTSFPSLSFSPRSSPRSATISTSSLASSSPSTSPPQSLPISPPTSPPGSPTTGQRKIAISAPDKEGMRKMKPRGITTKKGIEDKAKTINVPGELLVRDKSSTSPTIKRASAEIKIPPLSINNASSSPSPPQLPRSVSCTTNSSSLNHPAAAATATSQSPDIPIKSKRRLSMRFFTTPEGELIEESAAAQDDKRKALRSLSSPRLTTVYKRDRERDQTTELEEADGEEGESEDMSEDKSKPKGKIFGSAKKKFSSMSKSTFRSSMRISNVKSMFVNNEDQTGRPVSARAERDNPDLIDQGTEEDQVEEDVEGEDPDARKLRREREKTREEERHEREKRERERIREQEEGTVDLYDSLALDQGLDAVTQKELLNKLLSDAGTAKTFVGSMVAQFTGMTESDVNWLSKPSIRFQWFDEYEEDPKNPHLLAHVDGYQRELGRPAYMETYRKIDKKTNFAFMEADQYRHYYRDYIQGKDHETYISHPDDDALNSVGPLIASFESPPRDGRIRDRLKVLIRTKRGNERTTIPNDSQSRVKYLKSLDPSYAQIRFLRIKEVKLQEDLLQYEDKMISDHFKFGVLYNGPSQSMEDEMYNNKDGTPVFEEFLDFLGDRVVLNGFTGFRGGLDVKTDTTGTHSVYTQYRGFEVMFHVSTLLPFFPDDPQQVERKRHLGNDVVVILFREGENKPFDPSIIRSQFNHVFFVVSPVQTRKGVSYRLAIGSKYGVKPFPPLLPEPAVFKKGRKFREFLLTKLINAERAALYAPDFISKLTNTRKIQLRDMVERHYAEFEAQHSNFLSRMPSGTLFSRKPGANNANT